MQPDTGKIYEGKVTGITNFGAFVELEPGTTGMVHISEVANSYVSEIKDFLTVGQSVKVKVLSVGNDGKISLSIKKAAENGGAPDRNRNPESRRSDAPMRGRAQDNRRPARQDKGSQTPESAFEDMLNKFKQRSDERMGDIRKNMDSKRRNTSRRRNGS
ncbi:MAG: S1 RNA-binding domain-containing protein [Oscillospiraceae bacterium]|nr:S1 RNA-binding domain-containing protein [Oscillospiraceae bacterium]